MIKRIKIRNVVIAAAALVLINLVFGYFISPALSSFIVDALNGVAGCKITLERVNIFPLTLSFTLRDLRIFDPNDPSKRMIGVAKVSVRASALALLQKRMVFSDISVKGADITVEGEPDGTFNLQKVIKSGGEEPARRAGALELFERFRAKKDWFSRAYNILKKVFSKKSLEKEKRDRTSVERKVTDLERGKRVKFVTAWEDYLFEVKKLSVKNARVRLEADGETVDVDRVGIKMRNLAVDPDKGMRLDGFGIKGRLLKARKTSGVFEMGFDRRFKRDRQEGEFVFESKKVDLSQLGFIYRDSLPVDVRDGALDLISRTMIVNDEIDSRNKLVLKGHRFTAKRGGEIALGFVPMGALCDSLNQIGPVELKFDITGTLDSPKFTGLEEVLLKLVRPYVENIKKEGVSALTRLFGVGGDEESSAGEGTNLENTCQSLKSLFKKDD